MGHVIRTWSAVCSEALHSQFGKKARPHLCMSKWNSPTSICKWNSPIELNPSYSGQAYCNRPCTGYEYKNTGRILTQLCVPSIIFHLEARMTSLAKSLGECQILLILSFGRLYFHLSALEAVYIKSCKPNLSRQKEFVYNLKFLR